MTTFYCPACGEQTENDDEMEFVPGGEIQFACECGTHWTITMEYKEEVEE